jgi:hypothetical protein
MNASTSTPSRAALCWDMGIPAMRSNGSFALRIKYSVRLWFHALLTNSSTCFLYCRAISKIKAVCSAQRRKFCHAIQPHKVLDELLIEYSRLFFVEAFEALQKKLGGYLLRMAGKIKEFQKVITDDADWKETISGENVCTFLNICHPNLPKRHKLMCIHSYRGASKLERTL